MKINLPKISLVIFLIGICFQSAYATHNIAGEITYERVGDPSEYRYKILLTTYTDRGSENAHRSEVEIYFGHGDPEAFAIVSAKEEKNLVASGIWRNRYEVIHKFPGPGTCYTISFNDPNRVESIININDSNSVNIPFYIETELCILNDLGKTSNNSPKLLEMPVSYACVNARYEHNPNAFDEDGDSLTYELIEPRKSRARPVDDYVDPDEVERNVDGTFSLNNVTGEIVWDKPMRQGLYNIAIKITEFRKVQTIDGFILRKIGSVVRDMQIIVGVCNNQPPIIDLIDDTCVVAGSNTRLRIPIRATDPNDRDLLDLTASGGPFIIDDSPAQSIGLSNITPPISTFFEWTVTCEHIRKQPYSVVINATDNAGGVNGEELTDLEQFNIQVIGPEPRRLRAQPQANEIELRWDAPACTGVVGYVIYRKDGPSDFSPGPCETGVPRATGFQQVAIVADASVRTFVDDNNGNGLFHGLLYCYRVTALYKNENQFEQFEGITSDEVCTQLKKDVPILTQATIENTDTDAGEVKIAWSSPLELDRNQHKPPYRYEFLMSDDLNGENFQSIANVTFDDYADLFQDTTRSITGLNTLNNPYSFRIDFYATNPRPQDPGDIEYIVGTAKHASTPRLRILPSFEKLELRVDADVTWQNDTFVFYKLNQSTGDFDSLGFSTENVFVDSNLINGERYCYLARTIGSLNTDNVVDPILNWSQENCGRPRDTIKPCPPNIAAEAQCDLFKNDLTWNFSETECAGDVVKYYIYFQNQGLGDFEKVDSVMGDVFVNSFTDDRSLLEYNLSGCYYVTSIDSFDNESIRSNIVCVDNCPEYELPNIITPNGDRLNDLFSPLVGYRFVAAVDVSIVNRWGQEVYTTENVDIGWDGTNQANGTPLASGVYFYVIDVTFLRLNENETQTIRGTIQLSR